MAFKFFTAKRILSYAQCERVKSRRKGGPRGRRAPEGSQEGVRGGSGESRAGPAGPPGVTVLDPYLCRPCVAARVEDLVTSETYLNEK